MNPINRSNQQGVQPSFPSSPFRLGLAVLLLIGPLGCFKATPFPSEDSDTSTDTTDTATETSSTIHESFTAESSTTSDFTEDTTDDGPSADEPSASEASSTSTSGPSTSASSSESEASPTEGEDAETSSVSTSTSSSDETDSSEADSTTENESDSDSDSGTSTSGNETTDETGAEEDSEASTGNDPECQDHNDCKEDPNHPYCEPDSGTCVQCLTNNHCSKENAPFCNPDQHRCEPCTEIQGQCGEAACHVAEGSCLPQDQVWYVDASANNCNDSGPGSKAVPFCEIRSAVNAIESAANKSGTAHILGKTAYKESVTIAGNSVTALIGKGDSILQSPDGFNLTIYQLPESTAYLSGLSLNWTDNQQQGDIFLCTKSKLWLNRTTMDAKLNGRGLIADNCMILANKSTFLGNGTGPDHSSNFLVLSDSSHINFENSIVATTGNGEESVALFAQSDSTITLNYSTVLGNHSTTEGGHAIRCEAGANNKIRVRNSLILDRPHVSSFENCEDLNVSYSALSDGSSVSGSTNKILQPLPDMAKLFVDPFGVAVNLNLLKPGVGSVDQLKDVALRASDKDPPTDIHGKSRPAVGQRDWPGADIAD